MSRNYYDDEFYRDIEYFASEKKYYVRGDQRKLLLRAFKKFSPKKICEIGCGLSPNIMFFKKHGYKIAGCDISKKAIDYCKKRDPNGTYFVHNFEKKPLVAKFDMFYAFDVIEHIFDYKQFLKNVAGSLNRRGVLVLSTPNVLAPRNRIRMLLGSDAMFRNRHHIRWFSPAALKEILADAGFRVLEMKGAGKLSFIGSNFGGTLYAVAQVNR